jgi:hypothetical protein
VAKAWTLTPISGEPNHVMSQPCYAAFSKRPDKWGAVCVTPDSAQFVDVQVSGKIVASTGAKLALEVTVKDH